jgi:hypothetical protein
LNGWPFAKATIWLVPVPPPPIPPCATVLLDEALPFVAKPCPLAPDEILTPAIPPVTKLVMLALMVDVLCPGPEFVPLVVVAEIDGLDWWY